MSQQIIVNSSQDLDRFGVLWQLELESRGFKYSHMSSWRTFVHPSPKVEKTIAYLSRDHDWVWVFEANEVVTSLRWSPMYKELRVEIWGPSQEACDSFLAQLRETYSPIEPSEGSVPVNFWTTGMHGPRNFTRDIVVPEWADISSNYPGKTYEELGRLMKSGYQANAEGGKLILWHGPPGTGKTFALRALASKWIPWCDTHYIVDPDSFFGGSADYLFEVMLSGSDSPDSDKWKLLVCEDTGELLAADAKQQTGQALSRFLNLADGLIGQGLKLQILVTTNDEITQFHPAVIRNGRVVSNVRFDLFDRMDASRWLGRDGLTQSRYTLAELFALSRGESTQEIRSVGFDVAAEGSR